MFPSILSFSVMWCHLYVGNPRLLAALAKFDVGTTMTPEERKAGVEEYGKFAEMTQPFKVTLTKEEAENDYADLKKIVDAPSHKAIPAEVMTKNLPAPTQQDALALQHLRQLYAAHKGSGDNELMLSDAELLDMVGGSTYLQKHAQHRSSDPANPDHPTPAGALCARNKTTSSQTPLLDGEPVQLYGAGAEEGAVKDVLKMDKIPGFVHSSLEADPAQIVEYINAADALELKPTVLDPTPMMTWKEREAEAAAYTYRKASVAYKVSKIRSQLGEMHWATHSVEDRKAFLDTIKSFGQAAHILPMLYLYLVTMYLYIQ